MRCHVERGRANCRISRHLACGLSVDYYSRYGYGPWRQEGHETRVPIGRWLAVTVSFGLWFASFGPLWGCHEE